MSTVSTTPHHHERDYNRPLWMTISIVIVALCAATVAGWYILYNNVEVADHKTVAPHTIDIEE